MSVLDRVRVAPSRAAIGPRIWQRLPTPVGTFWVTTLGVLALIVIRNTYIFTTHIYEDGDFALNSIFVTHTQHSVQLVGPHSRVGFDHPGPVYLYVISAGQTVFYNLLHVVPGQYNGQVLGDAILQSTLIGLIVMSVYRMNRSRIALVVAGSVTFAYAATHQMLGYVWLPNMYMTAFALLVASGTALAVGHTKDLPLFTLAAGLLVHGHVAFIVFVGASAVIFGLGWINHHRTGWRQELRDCRRSRRLSLVIAAVFALPMVAEIVFRFPGPWLDYYQYSTKQATQAHSATDSLSFLGHFWAVSLATSVAFAAAAIAVLAALLDRNRRRRSYFRWGYLILVLETILFFYYIVNGIDVLDSINYYTGWFYECVPMFLVVFALTHAGLVVHEQLSARGIAWVKLATPVASVVLAATLVIAAASSSSFPDTYRGSDVYPEIVAALAQDPDRGGRPIVLDLIQDDWPAAAGTLVEAHRSGLALCLEDPYWAKLFTSSSMCSNAGADWQVAILPREAWDEGGAVGAVGPVIWSNAEYVVFEGTTPHMAAP